MNVSISCKLKCVIHQTGDKEVLTWGPCRDFGPYMGTIYRGYTCAVGPDMGTINWGYTFVVGPDMGTIHWGVYLCCGA